MWFFLGMGKSKFTELMGRFNSRYIDKKLNLFMMVNYTLTLIKFLNID